MIRKKCEKRPFSFQGSTDSNFWVPQGCTTRDLKATFVVQVSTDSNFRYPRCRRLRISRPLLYHELEYDDIDSGSNDKPLSQIVFFSMGQIRFHLFFLDCHLQARKNVWKQCSC